MGAAAALATPAALVTFVALPRQAADPSDVHVTGVGLDRAHPVLAATADCSNDGASTSQIAFRIRNVDSIAHTGQLVYDDQPLVLDTLADGTEVTTFTVVAGAAYSGRVDDLVDDAFDTSTPEGRKALADKRTEHLDLFVRYSDAASSGLQSNVVKIRPNRCLDDNPGTRIDHLNATSPPRVNGPAGVLGLECHDGVRKVAYDITNTDSRREHRLSVNVYSEPTGSVDEAYVLDTTAERFVRGDGVSGVADYPSVAPYGPDYTGDTLLRGWFRTYRDDPDVRFADPGLYHSRAWYETTARCTVPSDLDAPVWAADDAVRIIDIDDDSGDVDLGWPAASDAIGVDHYVVLVDDVPFATTGPQHIQPDGSIAVRVTLPPGRQTVGVVATDADVNRSDALIITVDAGGRALNTVGTFDFRVFERLAELPDLAVTWLGLSAILASAAIVGLL